MIKALKFFGALLLALITTFWLMHINVCGNAQINSRYDTIPIGKN